MMNGSFNKFSCKTCRSWDPCYPGNKDLGKCKILPIFYDKGILSLMPASDWRDIPEPTRKKIKTLNTTAYFGCGCYLPKTI